MRYVERIGLTRFSRSRAPEQPEKKKDRKNVEIKKIEVCEKDRRRESGQGGGAQEFN